MRKFMALWLCLASFALADDCRLVKIDENRILIDHRACADPVALEDPAWVRVDVSSTNVATIGARIGDHEINWNTILYVATLDNQGHLVVPTDFQDLKSSWLDQHEILSLQERVIEIQAKINAADASGLQALVDKLAAERDTLTARISELSGS